MVPELPQELFDVIIDHLFDDFASLKACSLASSTKERVDRLVDIVQGYPTFPKYIRSLAIERADKATASIRNVDLSRLFSLDFQVKTLVFTNVDWTFELPRAFPSIFQLTLHWCTFADFRRFQALLGMLPSVRYLRMFYTRWEAGTGRVDADESYAAIEPPRIRHLTVFASKLESLGRWLGHHGVDRSLRTIRFSDYGSPEFKACVRLIEAAGKSLVHLELGALSDNRGWKDLLQQHSGFLSHNTNLRTLELRDVYLTDGSTIPARVVQILENISTNSLRSLTLHIIVHDIVQLDELEWGRLVKVLNEYKAFARLRTLVFKLGGSLSSGLIQQSVEGRVSDLAKAICVFEGD